MSDKDKIEKIREKKKRELQKTQEESPEVSEEQIREQQREQIDRIVKQLLTSDARKRLNTVEMRGDEERVEKIKSTLVQLSQSGRLEEKVTDKQMKKMLSETAEEKDNYNIRGMSARRNNRDS